MGAGSPMRAGRQVEVDLPEPGMAQGLGVSRHPDSSPWDSMSGFLLSLWYHLLEILLVCLLAFIPPGESALCFHLLSLGGVLMTSSLFTDFPWLLRLTLMESGVLSITASGELLVGGGPFFSRVVVLEWTAFYTVSAINTVLNKRPMPLQSGLSQMF